MRKLRLADLAGRGEGPVVAPLLPGITVERGGFRIYDQPGFRTHQDEGGRHVHGDPEVFVVYQGTGDIEINDDIVGTFQAGDVILVEPGEDHHLISRGADPLVLTWMRFQHQPHEESPI